MTNNPYILDILSQPASLKTALNTFDPSRLARLAEAVQTKSFDRILLTGMGGSLYASYPVWLILAQAGYPAMWIDTAELIHHIPAAISSRTLFWLFSQSGRSAEIVSALDFTRLAKPAAMLATVNDPESPLGKAIAGFDGLSAQISIHALAEKTVSTRTFVNTLAVGQLAALCLIGADVEAARADLRKTADFMQIYLSNWEERVARLSQQIGLPKRLVILGRGPSLASVYAGALILGEAAKYAAIPLQAGEFRHGPLELAGPDLTALIFAGPQETRELNMRLLNELRGYGSHAIWIGSEGAEYRIEIPEVPAIGLPLMEIVVIQLLSIHLARAINVEPGYFFRSGKITLSE